MKTCPFCAEDIQDAAVICKHCGRALNAASEAPPQVGHVQVVVEQKRRTGIVTWAIAVFVGLIFVNWCALTFRNPPEGPIKSSGVSAAAPAPAVKTPAPPPASKWVRSDGNSKLDDSKTLVYSVEAVEPISAWLSNPTPNLITRCQRGRLEAYVVTGTAATVEYGGDDEHRVEIRFDDAKSIHQRWGQSTDDKALFSPAPSILLKSLTTAKRFRFGFRPFNGSPQVAEFDVHDFGKPYAALLATCRMNKTAPDAAAK